MSENRNDHDEEEYLGYMGYGDGAIFSLIEREGEETILSRRKRDAVRENHEQAIWKWIAYFQGSEEDGNPEPQGEGV